VTRPDERIGPEDFRGAPRSPAVLEVDGPDSDAGLGVSGAVLCGGKVLAGLVAV
jgi:hypothetical protein